jgi:GNAT superfamily N-acetyltransferase
VPSYSARPYEGEGDLRALIAFAHHVTTVRLPHHSSYHPGDFVWQLYAHDRSDDARIWRRTGDDGAILACAIFEPPLRIEFEIDPGTASQRELTGEVVRWAGVRRALVADKDTIALAYHSLGNDTLSTTAFDSDGARIASLVEHGFTRDDRQGAGFLLMRSLVESLPEVRLPAGARFRQISDSDADVEARAELHRDAWSVWGESRHTAEMYRRLRSAPLYDPELDVVLECDGQLVSSAVCWLDVVNKIGLFEPVGTRSSATRRGFGRVVIHEAWRRLRDKGMRTAIVGTGEVNRPAMALYASAGFEACERSRVYVKPDAAV